MNQRYLISLFGLFLVLLASSSVQAQTHTFARGGDGSLMHFDGAQWRSLGGKVVGAPDACSWGSNRIDVVVRGEDNKLWQIARIREQWSRWYDLGGTLTSSPTCVSRGPNRIDIFARGADGTLVHKQFDGQRWTDWESLGGFLDDRGPDPDTRRRGESVEANQLPADAAPDAASWGMDRIDVFVRGRDNALWQKTWDGTGWAAWHNLGGHITSDPGAVSWGTNRIDIFARDADGQITQITWDGTRWTEWHPHGGQFALGSGPDASSSRVGRLDISARGTDGALWRKSWDGQAWSEWGRLGGRITSDPGSIARRGLRGRFRVTLNGFTVNRETWDHALHADGQHDEVFVVCNLLVINSVTQVLSRHSGRSRVLGEVNDEDWRTSRVRAGSASDGGGLQTGDDFPSREPWRRTTEPQEDRLPMLMWEGELIEGENAVVVIPTIWEWDGDDQLIQSWDANFESRSFTGPWLGSGGGGQAVTDVEESFRTFYVSDAGSLSLTRPRNFTNRLGVAGDRPIGMRAFRQDDARNSGEAFRPQQFVLTYAAAQMAARTSYSDKGPGIVVIRYRDHPDLGSGEYTLYLHVESLR